ncbi:MAG: glycosyl transferase, partial [Rhodospirillales bacterium]|nr:glycosyl transferase [Rhodospirillales bacterium]
MGCFIDDETDWRYVEEVRGFCADSCFVRLKPRLARLRCLAGMVAGEALTLPYFRDDGLTRWVRGKLAVQPMPSFIFSSAMAQYVMNGARPGRIVMDFGDVDSDKWRQYAATQSWPM